jgi:hypothetical protein
MNNADQISQRNPWQGGKVFLSSLMASRCTKTMKNKNNMLLWASVFISVILILVLTILPIAFSQSVEDSTSLQSQSSTPQGQGREISSTNNIQITKTSINSYNIADGQTGLIGAFDTLYLATGSSDSLNNSKDMIISTIQDDFDNSPTIGYVRADNVTGGAGGTVPPTSIANPFVDQQTINSTIAQEISDAIDLAHSLDYHMVAIKCDFGMNISEWQCDHHGIFD